jgi:zinc transport system substrate-binding protein
MRRSYLLILLCFSLVAPGCSPVPNFWADAKSSQKRVLVSFPPLYSFAHAVAGEDGYVLCLLTSQGPHGHDVAATDMYKVNKADLFIYNGLTLDDLFADKMMHTQKNQSIFALNVGEVLLDKHDDLLLHGDGEEHEVDGVKHKHGSHDPHVWLAPDRAIAMTKIIADKLVAIDPTKEKKYRERETAYIAKLKDLDEEGRKAFKGKGIKMVTMHEAFAYFAKAFDITIVDTIQKRPGLDPDSASMARLIKACKKENVSVIAVEPQYSRAQAEALQATLKADGIDVAVISLDPMETADVGKGQKFNPDPDFYIKKMKENIAALKAVVK